MIVYESTLRGLSTTSTMCVLEPAHSGNVCFASPSLCIAGGGAGRGEGYGEWFQFGSSTASGTHKRHAEVHFKLQSAGSLCKNMGRVHWAKVVGRKWSRTIAMTIHM